MVARVIHCKSCGIEADQYKEGMCKACWEASAELLLDRIWKMIQAEERGALDSTWGRGSIPNFRVCVTPEQKHKLLSYINTLDVGKRNFIGQDGKTIFGCEVREVFPPYVERI